MVEIYHSGPELLICNTNDPKKQATEVTLLHEEPRVSAAGGTPLPVVTQPVKGEGSVMDNGSVWQ